MRPSLSRASGLLLCWTLAIAPDLAWAAPIRTNLEKSQATSTEVRWQTIPQSEKVTEPWQLVSSTKQVKRIQQSPQVTRFQEFRTDLYRQRTTTYPLEEKEQRVKTTTTQNYELKTYAEKSTSSVVMVPVTKEVGAFETKTVEEPVMTTIQDWSNEPFLITVSEPVYKTVVSSYSIPSEPIMSTVSYTKTRQEARTETVTKYREETKTTQQTVYYNGPTARGGNVQVLDEGKTIVIKGVNPYGPVSDLPPEGVTLKDFGRGIFFSNPFKSTHGKEIVETVWLYNSTIVNETCDTMLITVYEGLSNNRNSQYRGGAGGPFDIPLRGKLKEVKTVTTSEQVPYTATVTKMVDTPTPATFSIQLETMTNQPKEMKGNNRNVGSFWRHYHYPGTKCPYEPVTVRLFRLPNGVLRYDDSELRASKDSPVICNFYDRFKNRSKEENAAFELVPHHTDILPIVKDDATPATIETREEKVIDHYESKQVWSTKAHLAPKQVPVKTVVRWVDKPASYVFRHTHDDPTMRCEDKYLRSPSSPTNGGMIPYQSNPNRPGNSYRGGNNTWGSPGGRQSPYFEHYKEPVFGPATTKVTRTEWATKSITVMEPQTVTSTYSVLVSSVPGQEISSSYSPWTGTGEKRRAGSGSTQETTRTEVVAGTPWTQNLTSTAYNDVQPLKAQASSFASDRTSGNGRLVISGSALRLRLRANQTQASLPHVATVVGSVVPDPKGGDKRGGGNRGSISAQSVGRSSLERGDSDPSPQPSSSEARKAGDKKEEKGHGKREDKGKRLGKLK